MKRSFHVVHSEYDLENGMGTGRMGIGRGLTRGSNAVAVINQLQNVVHTVHLFLSQANNYHLLLAIF